MAKETEFELNEDDEDEELLVDELKIGDTINFIDEKNKNDIEKRIISDEDKNIKTIKVKEITPREKIKNISIVVLIIMVFVAFIVVVGLSLLKLFGVI